MAVTAYRFLESWTTGDTTGKRHTCALVEITAATITNAAGINSSEIGFRKIYRASNAYWESENDPILTTVNYDGTKVYFVIASFTGGVLATGDITPQAGLQGVVFTVEGYL